MSHRTLDEPNRVTTAPLKSLSLNAINSLLPQADSGCARGTSVLGAAVLPALPFRTNPARAQVSKRRMEAIMTNRFGQKLNRGKKVLLIGAAATALAIPLAVGSVEPRLSAQSPDVPRPRISDVFDAASVKPSHSRFDDGQKGAGKAAMPAFEVNHLTFRARGLNLFGLIVEAYGLKSCRPLAANSCPMLIGGPPWLTRDTFDIDAKSPPGSKEYTTMELRNGEAPQLQEELRNLLADRFHLKAHFEKRQLPVYAFTVANGGIRMKKRTAVGAPSKIIFKSIDLPGGIQATQVIAVQSTVQELADLYARFMERPVVDASGLTDRFDFTVQYEVDTDAAGPFAGITTPTLFEAFENQAGLKLRATRGPVSVLVVDSVTRPGAN
jgi:bla regulator protein blaR1